MQWGIQEFEEGRGAEVVYWYSNRWTVNRPTYKSKLINCKNTKKSIVVIFPPGEQINVNNIGFSEMGGGGGVPGTPRPLVGSATVMFCVSVEEAAIFCFLI